MCNFPKTQLRSLFPSDASYIESKFGLIPSGSVISYQQKHATDYSHIRNITQCRDFPDLPTRVICTQGTPQSSNQRSQFTMLVSKSNWKSVNKLRKKQGINQTTLFGMTSERNELPHQNSKGLQQGTRTMKPWWLGWKNLSDRHKQWDLDWPMRGMLLQHMHNLKVSMLEIRISHQPRLSTLGCKSWLQCLRPKWEWWSMLNVYGLLMVSWSWKSLMNTTIRSRVN